MQGPFALLLVILVLGTTAFVVFVERAQRRIPVNYAKRQVGRRMYAGQSSHLPFKLNMSGVIPPIFASSLLLFPATLASFAGTGQGPVANVMQNVAAALGYGQPLHLVIYAALIIFFCFFYTALVFNARDTADNLKKSGAFIPGIRPGQQTAEYIDKVLTRLTLWGALYVTAVCLLPEILVSWQGRAVPLRRHVAADRRGGGDGLHVAAAGSHDVASLSGPSQEGQSARLRPQRLGWLIMKVRPSVKKICKNCKIVRRRRVVYVICTGPASQAAPGLR